MKILISFLFILLLGTSAFGTGAQVVRQDLEGKDYGDVILAIDDSLNDSDVSVLCKNDENKCVAIFKTQKDPDYNYVVNFKKSTRRTSSIIKLPE